MARKRGRQTGKRQDRDSYLKWDAVARLVDAAVSLLKLTLGR